jgi:hypothetical protein
MKQIIRTLAFLAALLLPGLAAAQCSAPLPANTVMGRLGIGPGPCEAIPFANIPLAVGGSIIGGSVGAPLFNNGGVVGNGLIASTWSTFLQVGSGAVTRTVQSKLTDMVNARDFGVVCDGVTDDAAAIRLAYAASLNVYFPSSATKCVVKSQVIITAVNSGGGGYNLGPRLMGGGREAGGTTFDNQVANNCMFLIQSAANGQFTSGVTLENFKITSTTAPATSCGIEIYRGAYVKFSNVQFTSLTGRCIYVPATAGDPDAFIQISLDRVRTDNCATGGGFGLDFSAPTGGYSGSNLRITNSTFSGSGVDSAGSAPTSGGMVFKA